MRRACVDIAEHRDRSDPELAAGPDHAQRDLTPVRDENL
jgi:hypothetical protein